MKKVITRMVVLALLVSFVNGCTGGGESPSDVVKAFYKAGNEGNYAKAKSYLSIHTQMTMEMIPEMSSFEEQMDAATKGGKIARIEIKGGEKGDSVAIVYLTLYFKDGSQEQDVIELSKEEGKWKIYMSTWLMQAPFMELKSAP